MPTISVCGHANSPAFNPGTAASAATPPAALVIPADMLEAGPELEDEGEDGNLWGPVGRVDH